MAWVEKYSRSTTILRDLLEMMTTAVKDPLTGAPVPAKNWQVVYPADHMAPPQVRRTINEKLTADATYKVFSPPADKKEIVQDQAVRVFVAGADAPRLVTAQKVALTANEDNTVFSAAAKHVPFRDGTVSVYVSGGTTDTLLNEAKSTSAWLHRPNYYGTDYAFTHGSVDPKSVKLKDGTGKDLLPEPQVTGETLTVATDNVTSSMLASPAVKVETLKVYVDGQLVDPASYTYGTSTRKITFNAPLALGATVTVDYVWVQWTFNAGNTGVKFTTTVPGYDVLGSYSYGHYYLDRTNGKVTMFAAQTNPVKATFTYDAYRYSVDYAAGQVIFEHALEASEPVSADFSYNSPARLVTYDELINSPSLDRIVLATTTTPRQNDEPDPSDPTSSTETATMYLEIRRSELLKNPNTGTTQWLRPRVRPSDVGSTLKTHNKDGEYIPSAFILTNTPANHHYVEMRMFDKLDADVFGPGAGAQTSQWSKLSWYKDWETVPLDKLLGDKVGVSITVNAEGTDLTVKNETNANLFDGMVQRPIETTPVKDASGDYIPVRLWMNSNNDRVTFVVMGDPVVDFNQYLISFGYVGQLDSFTKARSLDLDEQGNPVERETRHHDVVGNFALTVGSSTPPVGEFNKPIAGAPEGYASVDPKWMSSVDHPKQNSLEVMAQIRSQEGDTSNVTSITQTTVDRDTWEYVLVGSNSQGISGPSAKLSLTAQARVKITYKLTSGSESVDRFVYLDAKPEVTLTFSVPEGCTHVRLYRGGKIYSAWQGKTEDMEHRLTRVIDLASLERLANGQYVLKDRPRTDHSAYDPSDEKAPNAAFRDKDFGVQRDSRGFVTGYQFGTKFGRHTGTGVLDVTMAGTKSGVPWQRHAIATMATDKTLSKDPNGFGLSMYTKKFHLSPIYVVHGFEGHRGYFSDVLAVDGRLLYHLDDLIVDRDTPNQKVYKFFKINAPFSVFGQGPDGSFGIAILKKGSE